MIIWRDIPGYTGIYQVSNTGIIRSLDHYDKNGRNRIKGRELKPGKKENGYLQVRLSDGEGVSKNYYVHRLVANMFLGSCPDGYEVNHIDENKANNSAENLEYITHRENINHGTSISRMKRKLGKSIVQLSAYGDKIAEYMSTMEAERKTGIWHNNISKACKGKAKTAGGYFWSYK